MNKLKIEIKCFSRHPVLNKAWWNETTSKLTNIILQETNIINYKQCYVYLSVNIINNNKMKELNYSQRGINGATDVLSFPIWNKNIPISLNTLEIGDIFISLDKIKEQSKEYNHSLEREASFLFTHGLLHLLGYDHETKHEEIEMLTIQEKCLNLAGFSREWIE